MIDSANFSLERAAKAIGDADKLAAVAGPLFSCVFASCAEQVSYPCDMLSWGRATDSEGSRYGWICDPCAEATDTRRGETLRRFLSRLDERRVLDRLSRFDGSVASYREGPRKRSVAIMLEA